MNHLPTFYGDTLFRSQLEAQWAFLFTWIDIPWVYEPCRKVGWVPDFELPGGVLAEVKPVPAVGAMMAVQSRRDFEKALRPYTTMLLGKGVEPFCGALVRKAPESEPEAYTITFDRRKEEGKTGWRLLKDHEPDPQHGTLRNVWAEGSNVFKRRSFQETNALMELVGRLLRHRRPDDLAAEMWSSLKHICTPEMCLEPIARATSFEDALRVTGWKNPAQRVAA